LADRIARDECQAQTQVIADMLDKLIDAEAKRRIITDMLDKLKAEMMVAVEKMPELQWFLVRRGELFCIYRPPDRLRRKAYENVIRLTRMS
jgi:hypothetical protein